MGPVNVIGVGPSCIFCKHVVVYRQADGNMVACAITRKVANPKECKIKEGT